VWVIGEERREEGRGEGRGEERRGEESVLHCTV
jgi:hypothetical protein